jgi:hypothetical protein
VARDPGRRGGMSEMTFAELSGVYELDAWANVEMLETNGGGTYCHMGIRIVATNPSKTANPMDDPLVGMGR